MLEDLKQTVYMLNVDDASPTKDIDPAVVIDPTAINEHVVPEHVVTEVAVITPAAETPVVIEAAPADLSVIKLPPKTQQFGRQKGAGCTQIKKSDTKKTKKKNKELTKSSEVDIIDDIINVPDLTLVKPGPSSISKKKIKEKTISKG